MDHTVTIAEKAVLTESDLWQTHEPVVWKAGRFEGAPHFYPVYRCGEHYSYSPLALARLKGGVRRNEHCARVIATTKDPYCPPDVLIDSQIRQIGQPRAFTGELKSRPEFLERLAAAINADVREIEARNPGHTNFILCGGRDSLNGLLLNWTNPTVVLSADPNFELVRDFIRTNGLPFEIVRLSDYVDEKLLDREVAEAFCRLDMQHLRWLPHLAEIGREVEGKAIFWMGSLGDCYFTPHWMKYTPNRGPLNMGFRKRYRRWARKVRFLRNFGWRHGIGEDVARAFWLRGAAWQGNYHSVYRAVTDCLTVSLYHGPETSSVLHSADLSEICFEDVRPELGYYLSGTRPEYPAGNPSPPPSGQRTGLWTVDRFADSLEAFGLRMTAE